MIVVVLSHRKAAELAPFTVMSCDNMHVNGQITCNVICSFARAVNTGLADWIVANVTFLSSMVGRIVPAVTADTLDKIEQITGIYDPAGVACEAFRQWVIEDNFVAGRPQREKDGAEMVADVVPFEEMKLRMLKGSHSFLAYLEYIAGYQYINHFMEDDIYRRAAYMLMLTEQALTLKVKNVDLMRYADLLIVKWSTKTGRRLRFSSIGFPIRLVVTHHCIHAV